MLQAEQYRDDILRWRAEGKSFRDISNLLKERGTDISHMGIARFCQSSNKIVSEVASRKEEFKERLASQQLNILDEIMDIARIVKEKIQELENSGQHQSLILYLKEFRSQLEFLAKLTGELNQTTNVNIHQNISYIQNNITEIVNGMTEESQKELAKFMVENSLLEHFVKSYLVNKGLEGLEKDGYMMIKITNNDDETRQLIKNLEKEGRIQVLTTGF